MFTAHTSNGFISITRLQIPTTVDIPDTISESYYVTLLCEENNPNNNNGSAKSNTISITITQTIIMPEYFTPNSNNKNSIYMVPIPIAYITKEFKFIVYDRWGTKVFETSDSSEGWNGRINGSIAPQGAYIYYLKIVGVLEQKGSFLLILQK